MGNSQCFRYKMAEKKSIIGNNYLCEELQAQILLRLPTKSAFRLKVVCKLWYSLISSPYFIERFINLRHHRDIKSSLVFQIRYYSGHYELKTLLCNNVYGFRLDYLPCSPADLRLEGAFDDLILCSCVTNPKKFDYYVINLLTRQWIALPPSPACDGYMETGILFVPVDTCHHKFMVVRISSNELPCSRFDVQVFSSEDGQWRTLVVSSPLPLRGSTSPLVAYRGMLHWLNYDCIVVYDPLNTPDTFSRIIHLPIRPARFKLCAWQGHLRVVEAYREGTDRVVEVWELRDYDSGLWNLVHKVYLNNLIYDNSLPSVVRSLLISSLSIVSLHPENGDVFYIRIDDGIAVVNMKTRIVERYYPVFHLADKWWQTVHISASFHLVDKWWPTPVSSVLH